MIGRRRLDLGVPFWLYLVVLIPFLAPFGPAAAATEAILPSLSPVLERVSPGVVNISVRSTQQMAQNPLFQDPFFRRFFDVPDMPQKRQVQAAGSGVILDAEKGYIVTNHHVAADADEIVVVLSDRRELKATLLGTDPELDIAVLKVDPKDLVSVPLGDSDKLKVGDFVVAIGNPFGLGQTATVGIIGALGRTGLGIEGYENFIQTDASINPGNSGGALINTKGELIGINTAILSRSGGNIGIGFAIPINMVEYAVNQIVEHGEVRRGRLGVMIQDLTPEIAQALGVDQRGGAVIARVVPDTPAEEAGIQPGDVVVSVNGEPVETSSQLRLAIGLMAPGDKVKLGIIRDGEKTDVTATLAKREAEQAEAGGGQPAAEGSKLAGASLQPLPSEHPLYGEVKGVLIAGVEPGSKASQAGLRAGDVIVSANRKPVTTPAELRKAAEGDEPLLLHVRRGDGAIFVVLK